MTGETGPSNDHGVWNSKIEVKMGENRKGIDVDLHRQSVLITVFKIKSGFLGIGEKKVILGLGEISLSDILINNRIEGKARIAGEKNQPFDVEVIELIISLLSTPFSFHISMAFISVNHSEKKTKRSLKSSNFSKHTLNSIKMKGWRNISRNRSSSPTTLP